MSNTDNSGKVAAGGAVAGAAGSIGSISALGVPGLGATGMTSGLATLGSVAGGGMATGLVIACVAPVAAGVVAYGLYKWLKD